MASREELLEQMRKRKEFYEKKVEQAKRAKEVVEKTKELQKKKEQRQRPSRTPPPPSVEEKPEEKDEDQLEYLMEHAETEEKQQLQQAIEGPIPPGPISRFHQQFMFQKNVQRAYSSLSNPEKIEYIKRYATIGGKTWSEYKAEHPEAEIVIRDGKPTIIAPTPPMTRGELYKTMGEEYEKQGVVGGVARGVSISYASMFRPETWTAFVKGGGIYGTGARGALEETLRWEHQIREEDAFGKWWQVASPAYINVVIPAVAGGAFGGAIRGIRAAGFVGFAKWAPRVGIGVYGTIETHRVATGFTQDVETGVERLGEAVVRFGSAYAGATAAMRWQPTIGVKTIGQETIAFQKHLTTFRGKPIIPYGKPLVLAPSGTGPQVVITTPYIRGQMKMEPWVTPSRARLDILGQTKVSPETVVGYWDSKYYIQPIRTDITAWQMRTGIPKPGVYTGFQPSTKVWPKIVPYWHTLIGRQYIIDYTPAIKQLFGVKQLQPIKKPKIIDMSKQFKQTETKLDQMPGQTQRGGLRTVQTQKTETVTIQKQKQELISLQKKKTISALAQETLTQKALKLGMFTSMASISLSEFEQQQVSLSAQLSGSALVSEFARVQLQLKKSALAFETPSLTVQQQLYGTKQAKISLQLQEYYTPQLYKFKWVFPIPTAQLMPPKIISPRIDYPKTKTPKIPIPKIPGIDFGLLMMEPKQQQGFDVYVKDRYYYEGKQKYRERFIKLNKQPLTETDALRFGATVTDRSAAQSFKIKPTTGKVGTSRVPLGFWVTLQPKFYKRKEVFIEKRQHAIDSLGELNEITARGWVAMHRTPEFQPKTRRIKRKKGKSRQPRELQLLERLGRGVM